MAAVLDQRSSLIVSSDLSLIIVNQLTKHIDHHPLEVVGRNHRVDLVVVGNRRHRSRMRQVAGNPAEAAGSLDPGAVHLAVVGFLQISSDSPETERITHLASSSLGFSKEEAGPGQEQQQPHQQGHWPDREQHLRQARP